MTYLIVITSTGGQVVQSKRSWQFASGRLHEVTDEAWELRDEWCRKHPQVPRTHVEALVCIGHNITHARPVARVSSIQPT